MDSFYPTTLDFHGLGELPTFLWLSSVLGVSSFNTGWDLSDIGVLPFVGRVYRRSLEDEWFKEKSTILSSSHNVCVSLSSNTSCLDIFWIKGFVNVTTA